MADQTPDGVKQPTRRGLLLVLSSPSGAGKTTLARRLLAEDDGLIVSVSATTRPARPGEIDGQHYHFVDQAQFDVWRAKDGLLEWATVFEHSYGTPRAPVEERLATGGDMVTDIDWQGAEQLAQKLPADVVRVFVLPPSIGDLEMRLRSRGQDDEDVIARRMARARDEISHWGQYDYVIVNRDLDESADGLRSILVAERLRRARQVGLTQFVRTMTAT